MTESSDAEIRKSVLGHRALAQVARPASRLGAAALSGRGCRRAARGGRRAVAGGARGRDSHARCARRPVAARVRLGGPRHRSAAAAILADRHRAPRRGRARGAGALSARHIAEYHRLRGPRLGSSRSAAAGGASLVLARVREHMAGRPRCAARARRRHQRRLLVVVDGSGAAAVAEVLSMHIHILGIAGTFMGGVAAIAKSAGFRVTGSDLNVYPPMSDQLTALGIELIQGYGAEQLDLDPDIVVVGNALSRGRPVIEALLDRGIPYTSGPLWLAEQVLRSPLVIAVTGPPGKTTTTAMLTWILEYAGLSPGYLVGGVPGNFESSARLGEPPFFVIEADEYDTAFFD